MGSRRRLSGSLARASGCFLCSWALGDSAIPPNRRLAFADLAACASNFVILPVPSLVNACRDVLRGSWCLSRPIAASVALLRNGLGLSCTCAPSLDRIDCLALFAASTSWRDRDAWLGIARLGVGVPPSSTGRTVRRELRRDPAMELPVMLAARAPATRCFDLAVMGELRRVPRLNPPPVRALLGVLASALAMPRGVIMRVASSMSSTTRAVCSGTLCAALASWLGVSSPCCWEASYSATFRAVSRSLRRASVSLLRSFAFTLLAARFSASGTNAPPFSPSSRFAIASRLAFMREMSCFTRTTCANLARTLALSAGSTHDVVSAASALSHAVAPLDVVP